MTSNFQAYNDAASRAMVIRFRATLAPLLEQVAPDWLLHHIEIQRDRVKFGTDEQVEIRLVIKPIGAANVVDPDGDLRTGPKRIEGASHDHATPAA